MKLNDYKELREQNRILMGQTMLDFESEMHNSVSPTLTSEGKDKFVKDWVIFFDEYFQRIHDLNDVPLQYQEYSIQQIRKAFEWTKKNFAELDLGGNMKWYSASSRVLEHLKNGTWTAKTERETMLYYMRDTRWFEK